MIARVIQLVRKRSFVLEKYDDFMMFYDDLCVS